VRTGWVIYAVGVICTRNTEPLWDAHHVTNNFVGLASLNKWDKMDFVYNYIPVWYFRCVGKLGGPRGRS
jgi:hypothetical protein